MMSSTSPDRPWAPPVGHRFPIVAAGEFPEVVPSCQPSLTAAPLYIGRCSDDYYNNVILDSRRHYSLALTQTEIKTIYFGCN